MTKEDFDERCSSDPYGRYFSYAQIIAECINPVREEIKNLVDDEKLFSHISWHLGTLQPRIARYLARLENPEITFDSE